MGGIADEETNEAKDGAAEAATLGRVLCSTRPT